MMDKDAQSVTQEEIDRACDILMDAGPGAHSNEKVMALARRLASQPTSAEDAVAFQPRVQPWLMGCFGAKIAADKLERSDRATEEMLELSQAVCASIGVDFAPRAHALVDYVAGRPVGEIGQEVGGSMVTLAALCLATGHDMDAEAERELARITQPEIVQKIRAKQAAKPTGSALPIAPPQPEGGAAQFVATDPVGSADEQNEDGSPLWYVEIQTIGGWSVVATVWGGSAEQAAERGKAVLAALQPEKTKP